MRRTSPREVQQETCVGLPALDRLRIGILFLEPSACQTHIAIQASVTSSQSQPMIKHYDSIKIFILDCSHVHQHPDLIM